MFDLLFVLVVGLSTAFAAMRGGLRELATLLSLAIAAGLAWIIAEPLLGVLGLDDSFFGTVFVIAALAAIFFIIAHIGFHILLQRTPLEGRARLADRVGGGAFGLFRGLVLIGLAYLGYSYYLDEERQPDSVRNAMTQPIAAGMASWFESFAPESTQIENHAGDGDAGNAAIEGYGRSDRNGLEDIVNTVTTTDPAIAATAGPTASGATGPEVEVDEEEDPIADILLQEEDE